MPEVALISTKNPLDVKKALEGINIHREFSDKEKILIKPNYVTDDAPNTGVTTDPLTVKGIIDYLLEIGFNKNNIIVGEGGMSDLDTYKTFKKVGLVEVLKDYNINLIDLNKDERVELEIGYKSLALKKVKVAKTYLYCDAIISVAAG
ncbi:MAG: DUF362 domain-containing protein [Methanosarcinales archaeon]